MHSYPERGVSALLLVNLALQLFDGVATYVGLHFGFNEGNPLLAWALGHVGPASALFLFKLQACACLLVLWRLRQNRLAVPALAMSAAIYVVCSVAPWTAALASAHLELYAAS
jgi:uncharacterized membrane protein